MWPFFEIGETYVTIGDQFSLRLSTRSLILSTNTTSMTNTALRWSGIIWFCCAAIGQVLFAAFIIDFYGARTAYGDFAGWNERGVITGYVAGDTIGNLVFISHVLLAIIVALGGIFQLVPAIRRRYPAAHRWNGRVFILVSVILAVGGLWAVWVRGSYLSVISGLSVSLNGVLILIFCALAYRRAVERNFVAHEVWAIRAFLVVSGVWFFRVFVMAWITAWQGPVGMTEDLTGPADVGLSLASYLVPLIVYELYREAKRSASKPLKIGAISTMGLATLVTAGGIAGATLFMWFPGG